MKNFNIHKKIGKIDFFIKKNRYQIFLLSLFAIVTAIFCLLHVLRERDRGISCITLVNRTDVLGPEFKPIT